MIKKYKWIYLPIEVKVRELDSKLLLAYYLSLKGFRVVIGEHLAVEKSSTILPSGIFFAKGYPNSVRHRMIKNGLSFNHVLVELDEEGLIIPNSQKYIKDRTDYQMVQNFSSIYCWGDFQKKILSDEYKEYGNKFIMTGNPRFDLLDRKYRNIYIEQTVQINHKHGDFILINTRFSEYNHVSGKKDTNEDNVHKYMKELYHNFISAIKQVNQKYPDINLIIRPHPTEDYNSYKREFQNYSKIKIITSDNVIPWILASKLLIHNGCTTGIEASLLEKPVISYMPIKNQKYDLELPNNLSKKAANINELMKLIDKSLDSSISTKTKNKTLRKYYYTKDYAYEHIIDLLHQIPVNEDYPVSTPVKLSYKMKKFKYRFPGLKLNEIKSFFEKLEEIEGFSNQLMIKEIGPNLFEIYDYTKGDQSGNV